jgi:hypothetical protein
MRETGVFKTESGTIFRVSQEDDGHLWVETLKSSLWEPAPIGMAGLRIASSTTRLNQRQIDSLPR